VSCAVLIDDLADRPTPVDVVVNGGFHAPRLHYRGKPDSVYLLGPRYALLDRPSAEPAARGAASVVRRVLVTLAAMLRPSCSTPQLTQFGGRPRRRGGRGRRSLHGVDGGGS